MTDTLSTLFPKGKILPTTARIEVWFEAIDPPVDMGGSEESLGFFKSKEDASAVSSEAGWGDDSTVRKRHVLTINGATGFLIDPDLITVKEEEGKKALKKIKEKALKKLSQAERKVLGL